MRKNITHITSNTLKISVWPLLAIMASIWIQGNITSHGVVKSPIHIENTTSLDVSSNESSILNTKPNDSELKTNSTFIVTSIGDGGDANPGDGNCDDGSGNCTLRAAIEEGNISGSFNSCNIEFNIPGGGVHTITPSSPYPTIAFQAFINGLSQPLAQCNNLWDGTGHNLLIEIDGTNAGPNASCFVFQSFSGPAGCEGIIINNFPGTCISFSAQSGSVSCNYLGTNAAGTSIPNLARKPDYGLVITDAMGSTTSQNLVAGAESAGILLDQFAATTIMESFIGTDATGLNALANHYGIHINCTGGLIELGGTNLISGNDNSGVYVENGGQNVQNFYSNIIGLNRTETLALANLSHGIEVDTNNTVNIGTIIGSGNVISGNTGYAIHSRGGNSQINYNVIGLNNAGTQAFPNGMGGIYLTAGTNTIGSSNSPSSGNIIAGNNGNGITLAGASGTTIGDNKIGLNNSGQSFPNTGHGIHLTNPASGNQIGGTPTSLVGSNTIANNGLAGIFIEGTNSNGNSILYNEIYNNGGLGIDIAPAGVNPNDAGDGDSGPNDLLNYIEITSISNNLGDLDITFTLDAPNNDYLVIFFYNPNYGADPTDHGEGEAVLGEYQILNHVGSTSYSITLSGNAVGDPNLVAATLTEGQQGGFGSTSEFSETGVACETLPTAGMILDVSAGIVCYGDDGLSTLSGSLPNGSYTITYDLSAPNLATGLTASMMVSNGTGGGTFIVPAANLTNSGNTTLTITEIEDNATGCVTEGLTISDMFLVNPELTASIDPGLMTFCAGSPIHFYGNATGGTKPYNQHLWIGDVDSLSATNTQNPVFLSSVPGTYTLHYTVTDNSLCSATASITFNIVGSVSSLPAPDPNLITWHVTFPYQGNAAFDPDHVIQTADGGYLVLGGNSGYQVAGNIGTIKLDSLGNHEWGKTHHPFNSGGIRSLSSVQLNDGGYVIAGTRYNSSGGANEIGFYFKISATGDMIWQKTYGNVSRIHKVLFEDSDGNVVLGGAYGSLSGSAYLAKIHSTNGTIIWEKNFQVGNMFNSVTIFDIVKVSNGYAYSGHGLVSNIGGYAAFAGLVDFNGNHLWTQNYGDGTHDMYIYTIETTGNDSLILGGSIAFEGNQGNGNRSTPILIELDAVGNVDWAKQYFYDAYAQSNEMRPKGLQVTTEGDLALGISGYYINSSPKRKTGFLKTDEDGIPYFLRTNIDYFSPQVHDENEITYTSDGGFIQTVAYIGGLWEIVKTDDQGLSPCTTIPHCVDYEDITSDIPFGNLTNTFGTPFAQNNQTGTSYPFDPMEIINCISCPIDIINPSLTINDICIGTDAIATLSGSLPDQTYTITFDLSNANTATGLSATMTISDGSGSGTFTIPSASLPVPGTTTLTITDISNDLQCSVINPNLTDNFEVGTLVVVNTNDDGFGSLRCAIETANAKTGTDNITFNIPNSHLIDPDAIPGNGDEYIAIVLTSGDLPTFTEAVVVAGLSQPGSYCSNNLVATLPGGGGQKIEGVVIRVDVSGLPAQGTILSTSVQNVKIEGIVIINWTGGGAGIGNIESNLIGTSDILFECSLLSTDPGP